MKPIKAAIVSIAGTKLSDDEKNMLTKENPLGVALFTRNIQTPEQLKILTDEIKAITERNDIIIATDQEGGRVCRLKEPWFRNYISQAAIASLDEENASKTAKLHAELIADDLHNVGINCNFAPTLDVATSKITMALKYRCFSEDEKQVTKLGRIMFDAYNNNGIISCIKHLPGHSEVMVDPHLELPKIEKVNAKYLYPFEQIAPNALMAMTAHVILAELDNKPVTISSKIIKNLIREKLNFRGILISDAIEMKALSGTLTERTKEAINAGCDVVCYCGGNNDDVAEVLDNCGYLSDDILEILSKIKNIINGVYTKQNIIAKASEYAELSKKAISFNDEYDVVETLNQMYKKMQ